MSFWVSYTSGEWLRSSDGPFSTEVAAEVFAAQKRKIPAFENVVVGKEPYDGLPEPPKGDAADA